MYDGGFFRGKSFTTETDDNSGKEYFFAIAWGKLIADTKVQMFNKKKTLFTIKYHNNAYLNIVIWGDSEAASIASVLEKGDMVFCAGTVTRTPYTVRKGAEAGTKKIWTDMNCQILLPMPSVEFLVAAHTSDAIAKLMENEESSKESDPFESAEYEDEV